MKLIITKKESFVGKKNSIPYVKLSFLSVDGATGEIFTTKEKFDAFGLDENKICSADTIKKIIECADVVRGDFDQKGYITSLE